MTRQSFMNLWGRVTAPLRKQNTQRHGGSHLVERHAELAEMLTYMRPAYSVAEDQFTSRFVDVLPGCEMDAFGNRYVTVGDKPRVMFSGHTDTVHSVSGRQKIFHDTELNQLFKNDTECLGADDGTGVWIMMNLIRAGVPGLYIFHQAEECGGQGSSYIAKEEKHRLDGIEFAIAFDRRGNGDVISHQAGGRCCSDAFATDFAERLGGKYKPCDGGVFTDTANYTHLISECTNLSVGYYNEHSKHEYQDLNEADELLTALLAVDWDTLVASRDPKEIDEHDWYNVEPVEIEMGYDELLQLTMNNPTLAADILFDLGCTFRDYEYAKRTSGSTFDLQVRGDVMDDGYIEDLEDDERFIKDEYDGYADIDGNRLDS